MKPKKNSNPALRDVLKMGFSQVMGQPGVAYYRKGKYFNAALDEVDAVGNIIGGKPDEMAAPKPVAPRNGDLDPAVVVFEHDGEKFTNAKLLEVAFAQSGLTAEKWNAQNDRQISARVTELVDDMKAMVAAGEEASAEAEGGGEGDGHDAEGEKGADPELQALLEAMNNAKAEMDAWTAVNDSTTKDGKSAYNKLNYAYNKAKKAYEKAAGLSE